MKSLRIGLMPQGGANWIAGVIYLQNLIRAARRLPAVERPDFLLLCDLATHNYSLMDSGEPQVPAYVYSHHEELSRLAHVRGMARSLRHGALPVSFDALVARLHLDAIFPANYTHRQPPPAPTISWIPDFQHLRLPQFFSCEERKGRDNTFVV